MNGVTGGRLRKHGGAGLLSVVVGLACLACGFSRASVQVQEQPAVAGRWVVEAEERGGRTRLTVHLQSQHGRMTSSTAGASLETLAGLTREQVFSAAGGRVRFRVVRDAGVFECEGWFKAGKGSGDFRFVPDRAFAAELGAGRLGDERLFELAVQDVSREFVRGMASLGYERVPVEQLIAMRLHGVGPEFVGQLRAAGYDRVAVADLVRLRIHDVNAQFIERMKARGHRNLTVEQLIRLRLLGGE